MSKTFKDSCVPFLRGYCAAGTKHIDPCSCAKFYKCDTEDKVSLQSCRNGTLYDHKEKTCRRSENVVRHKICSPSKPWMRCESIDGANIEKIEQRCAGEVVPKPTFEAAPLEMQPENTEGAASNVGLIVGLAPGLLLALLFVAIYFFYCKRKGQQTRQTGENRNVDSAVENPSYICTDDFMSPVNNDISGAPSSGPKAYDIATSNKYIDDHVDATSNQNIDGHTDATHNQNIDDHVGATNNQNIDGHAGEYYMEHSF